MASPPAPPEFSNNPLSLTITPNSVPLSTTTLSHTRRASEVNSIKRRKASMISTTSTHSAHPLRQTSFPPESAVYTPGYERSPSVDTMSLVSGSVAGGQSKRKRARKSKGGRGDFEGSNAGAVKSEGPSSKKRRTSTGNIEDDEEDDNTVDQTMTSMSSSIEEKQRDIQRRALLANHLDPEQFERYTAMRAVKFPDATIRRIVNQTLSQSVPATVILAVKSVAKQFVGELIEGARKVQTQWIAAGEPNSGFVISPAEDTNIAGGEPDGAAVKELRRAPLQADHLREALRRLRQGNEDGLAGQLNLWQLQQHSGVERFASRVGGKRLFSICTTFTSIIIFLLQYAIYQQSIMQSNNKEAQILLAIEAIRKDKKLSIRKAAKLYNISHTTLIRRMNGLTPRTEFRPKSHNLTDLEEEVLIQYILDMDERGFSPRISDVEDMANYILETRGVKKVGKLWAHRFVKRHTELKTRFNRVYDFQRALCEDSELIERWFRLVSNMRAKYGILDCDLYNFDETGFMMGQISPHIVVTKADRYGKSKAIQPGNREWATAIICVDGEGHNIPPFLIVKGEHHLSNWYTEGDLPYDWLIKPTTNGWTDNETGLEWIKHFNKHTESRKVGRYRMLVLDGHESHKSPAFQEYYKEHNIILLSLLSHSSHLTQPLDIDCFGPLKRSYNRQIKNFIKAHIIHITKTEFFQAFKAVYIEAISISNGKAGFRGAGLIPFNPEIVLSKLDIRIRTPSDRLISADLDIWQSQTPHNPTEALSQSTLVKSRIARHQGSSPTPIFETVAALAKGIELLAHANTLLTAEVHSLRKANEALSKLRRARKALIRKGGALSVEDGHSISEQENVEDQIRRDEYTNDGSSARRQATIRRCSKCGSTLHNARTCQFDPALVDL